MAVKQSLSLDYKYFTSNTANEIYHLLWLTGGLLLGSGALNMLAGNGTLATALLLQLWGRKLISSLVKLVFCLFLGWGLCLCYPDVLTYLVWVGSKASMFLTSSPGQSGL